MSALIPQFVVTSIDWCLRVFYSLPDWFQYLTITTWKILFVTIGVILIVAFSTYFERKVIGSMQARVGPNRVGPFGLGQPFADVIKLVIKEVVVPSQSSKFLFVIAPLLSLIPALATWAVIPLNDWYVIADINAGLVVRTGADVGWRLRRHSRWLGDQLEIRFTRRHAFGCTDRRV